MHVPIVLCFDNNFSKYAKITIQSLLNFARKETNYLVYCVVAKDVSLENIEILKLIFEDTRHELKIIHATEEFDNAHTHRNITTASYYRLLLHDLLINEKKVIYLDVDVLINADLFELYDSNIEEHYLGAVKNLYIYQVFDRLLIEIPYWKERFHDSKNTYFNAGVLLMNLDLIRKDNLSEYWKKLSLLNWEFHDQDILNFSCKNRVFFLPPKFNATYPIRAKGNDKREIFSKEALNVTPSIYHFTASKPWNSKYISQSDVWWKFLKKETLYYDYFLYEYKKNIPFKIRLVGKIRDLLIKFKSKIKIEKE